MPSEFVRKADRGTSVDDIHVLNTEQEEGEDEQRRKKKEGTRKNFFSSFLLALPISLRSPCKRRLFRSREGGVYGKLRFLILVLICRRKREEKEEEREGGEDLNIYYTHTHISSSFRLFAVGSLLFISSSSSLDAARGWQGHTRRTDSPSLSPSLSGRRTTMLFLGNWRVFVWRRRQRRLHLNCMIFSPSPVPPLWSHRRLGFD